jgi:SAM-dependent methyltransferase
MAADRYADVQRLAFGRVAELYDRARPSYPAAAVDAVVEFGALTPPARILEVGAGTGKATVLLADRGFGVLALEPSPAMARVARANCARHPQVEIVEAEFERWEPEAPLPALVSAAAWHWIEPEVRYQKAHRALAPGGTLAALWTFPDWQSCALRAPLSDAYRSGAPELTPDFPMHPDSRPTRLAGDWHQEIRHSGAFSGPTVRTFAWSERYTSAEYCQLLQTHQDHILLADAAQTGLLDAVAAAIEEAGGSLALPLVTYVCLAVRAWCNTLTPRTWPRTGPRGRPPEPPPPTRPALPPAPAGPPRTPSDTEGRARPAPGR